VKVKASAQRMSNIIVIGKGNGSGSVLSRFCGDDGGGIGSGKV